MTNLQNGTSADLINSLIEHLSSRTPHDWEQLAIVIYLNSGELGGTYGYAYSPNGSISAVAARPSGIWDAVHAYIEDLFGSKAAPIKLLVQFDRPSGHYEITFEDSDVNRWKVSPATIETVREELRPHFG